MAELDAYKEKYNRSYRERASLDAQLVETKRSVEQAEIVSASFDLKTDPKRRVSNP